MSDPHAGEPAQPDRPQFGKEGPADAGPPSQPPPAGAPQQGYPQQGYGQQQGYEQQGQPGYPAPHQGVGQELSPADQRMWAMLAHLGGILFGFLAPLVVYLVQKDRGQFVKEQSTEALNFQLTALIGLVASFILTFVIIGFFTLFAIAIAVLVFSILAGLAANKGENYRYPVNIRMIT